jgi:DNA mismatch endonuclease (patch repair protein)
MRAVRRAGTTAELRLAGALRARSLDFDTHARLVDCTPDVVFRAHRLAVFVDGDFWHGRIALERGLPELGSQFKEAVREFWLAKIARNIARDMRQTRRLRRHGWAVVRLWEKDVLRNPELAAAAVCKRLRARRHAR